MATINELIIKAAHAPEQLNADDFAELRRICRDYPAQTLAPALLLKFDDARLSDDERQQFRSRIALFAGDRQALISMIDPSGHDFAHFYPTENTQVTPSTENAIDTFLNTYGHQSPEEDALLERMIFNPVPEYAETLARQEQPSPTSKAPAGSQDSLIDAFLAANPVDEQLPIEAIDKPKPQTPVQNQVESPKSESQPSDSELLSESLAKIFIKQGRYERAYEIISNLSLNYPKKSVYFAVQLRFLRKLMINQRFAEDKNSKHE